MSTSFKIFVGAICFLMASFVAKGQEEKKEEDSETRHKITLEASHTHVPTSVDNNGKKSWQVLASWGLNYDFKINRNWNIGIHSDMVIQDFSYEDESGIVKKRTRPVATAIVGMRKFGDHLSIVGGGGMEVASEGTLGLVRIGLDYGLEIPGNWEFSASLMCDFKIKAYNAYVIGFGIGKSF